MENVPSRKQDDSQDHSNPNLSASFCNIIQPKECDSYLSYAEAKFSSCFEVGATKGGRGHSHNTGNKTLHIILGFLKMLKPK